ncbi:hypothetical protein C8R43DRAFT_904724, partial [Mycena crocata]
VFVPSTIIFRVSDAVPFHIQLSGSNTALQGMFSGEPGPFTHPLHPIQNSPIRVYLWRRVTMRVGDKNARRSIVLVEGTSHPLPSPFHRDAENANANSHALNWEGQVHCTDIATVGSFDAGLVVVKVLRNIHAYNDSIVVEISPPAGSPFRRSFVEHRIKFTANAWNVG